MQVPSFRKAATIFAGIATLLAAIVPTTRATDHHSWANSDTRYAYYASGVVTYVRWGNPHVEMHLRVENTKLPPDWAARPLPSGAQETDGRATMVSARPYTGPHQELDLTLAPPDWMERWG